MQNPITAALRSRNLQPGAVATVGLALLLAGCATPPPGTMKGSSTSNPVLGALSQFTAADVPAVGPEEIPIDPPNWSVSTNEAAASLPGKGLAQHPMLYIGEGCNKMFLV